jgi:hypothetical protein
LVKETLLLKSHYLLIEIFAGVIMPFNYKTGLGYQGAFVTSGRAWVTGSALAASGTVTVTFPNVAKSVVVINNVATAGVHSTTNTGSLAVHFGPLPAAETHDSITTGVYPWTTAWDGSNIPQIKNNHYIELADPNDSFTFDVKCKEVHVTCLGFNDSTVSPQATGVAGSFLLFAELTGVDANEMYELTGSGIDDEK